MLRGQKWKALINLRKFENDALKVRSVKNFKSLPGVPTVTAFVAAFDAIALNYKELLKSYLAGGDRIINRHRKPTHLLSVKRHLSGLNICPATIKTRLLVISKIVDYFFQTAGYDVFNFWMAFISSEVQHSIL